MSSTAIPAKDSTAKEIKEVRPFSDIPGPKGFLENMVAMSSWVSGAGDKILEQLGDGFNRYGKIYKTEFANAKWLNLCDVDAVEKLHRMEGKFPRRIPVLPWKEWRENNNLTKGVLLRCVRRANGQTVGSWTGIRLPFS